MSLSFWGRSAVLVTSVVLLVGCGETVDTYRGKGLSMSYPRGWTVAENDPASLVTFSHANASLRRVDGVLMVQAQPTVETSLPNIVSANDVAIRALTANQNIDTQKVTIAGNDTAIWSYDRIDTNSVKTYFRQTLLLHGGQLYTVTGTFEDSSGADANVLASIKSISFTN